MQATVEGRVFVYICLQLPLELSGYQFEVPLYAMDRIVWFLCVPFQLLSLLSTSAFTTDQGGARRIILKKEREIGLELAGWKLG